MKSFLISVVTLVAGLCPCLAWAQSYTVVTTKATYLYVTPRVQPQALASVEPGAEFLLVKLEDDWCLVEYQHPRWGRRRGYIQRSAARIEASSVSATLPNTKKSHAVDSAAPQPLQPGAAAAPKPLSPTPTHVAPPRPAPNQVSGSRPSAPAPPAPPASLSPRVPYATSTCESGHWIDAVEGDGKVIKLEDGSIWLVEDWETVTTGLWLPTSEVVVCPGKLINSDEGESADAAPLSNGGELGFRSRGYPIEAAANDETFVINGNIFKARTYCSGFDRGDRVLFARGSPSGACTSAELVHMRSGKLCRVWCE